MPNNHTEIYDVSSPQEPLRMRYTVRYDKFKVDVYYNAINEHTSKPDPDQSEVEVIFTPTDASHEIKRSSRDISDFIYIHFPVEPILAHIHDETTRR